MPAAVDDNVVLVRRRDLMIAVGGPVVECSPAARATRVRFPAEVVVFGRHNSLFKRSRRNRGDLGAAPDREGSPWRDSVAVGCVWWSTKLFC